MIWLILPAALALLFLFLLFPCRAPREARAPFEGRAYAHRGLYAPDQSVPENSLPAFRLAVEAGYGAELDVQLTKDGRVVVLHDDDLKRACGREGRVCQPLIVELKFAAPNTMALCAAVREMLAAYDGPACVESFHPDVVRYFRLHDPARIRGQLSQAARLWNGKLPALQGFVFSRLLLNFRARPHFIAYGVGPKPWPVRLCESLGAMKVCWTAREEALHEKRMAENDAVIFEKYRPARGRS